MSTRCAVAQNLALICAPIVVLKVRQLFLNGTGVGTGEIKPPAVLRKDVSALKTLYQR
jgi:hypothetical protein